MNFERLFSDVNGASVRFALSGAKGDFSRTLLAQTLLIPRLVPTMLCDLDLSGLHALCRELGYPKHSLIQCANADEVIEAPAGAIVLVADIALLDPSRCDILVEATGNPVVGYRAARRMIEAGRHVAMVSKEVDSVAGIALSGLANQYGVVYTTVEGDQPANLIGWVSWARTLGLEIVAAGKSGEYDLVFDPAHGTIAQRNDSFPAPQMAEHLTLGSDAGATLRARRTALNGRVASATADYCEMAIVAANTGLIPDIEGMHYPIARPSELADIYALRVDGGILTHTGVVDVFNTLRLPHEASFAGGVFVVVRTHDAPTWAILAEKGHVVSRNGLHACLYWPYHCLGVEAPISLLSAVLRGWGSGADKPAQHAILGGRASMDLAAGTVLEMSGHHHDISSVQAVLVAREVAPADIAPLYLMAEARIAQDVKAGSMLLMGDLAGYDFELHAAWRVGFESHPGPGTRPFHASAQDTKLRGSHAR